MTRIDSHQHFWKFSADTHAWITPDMAAIQRDFSPEELWPLLNEADISGCVTVQVEQSLKETSAVIAASDQHNFIKGVVGWVDFAAPDISEQLATFQQKRKLKGFRHIVQAEPPGFLLNESFINGVKKLRDHGFTYDLLIYPHQLEDAFRFVRQVPDQKIVVDHLAKPQIKKQLLEPWKKQIEALSKFENVFCKLSGLVTEADWNDWKTDDFKAYIETVVNAFGTKRLLYGSDWPVCLLAASYSKQLEVITASLRQLSRAEKEDVMGNNAIQFYNL